MVSSELKIEKLTPALGAEISGVDLAALPSAKTQDAIYRALLDHLVIFFRDQDIPPESHLAFARTFGEPEPPHPVYPHVPGFENIVHLANDVKTPPDTNGWHTDLTFQKEPPFASILLAREVPDCGGDTLWSSLYAAYDALPGDMKSHLADLKAVHDMGDFRNNFAEGENAGDRLAAAMGRFGCAVHPVVKRHPATGRPFLFVNPSFTSHIAGLRSHESDNLLRYLYSHMERAEFQVRFRWRKNSLAMWDNRVTMHYAVADYLPAYRSMNRITVIRDRRATASSQAAQ